MTMQPTITNLKPEDCSVIVKYHSKLSSPLIIDDSIFCVAENGDIIKINEDGQTQIVFTILGQPSSLAYREAQQYFIVSDFAHQSIFSRQDTKNQQIHNLITQFNDRAFLGPNTLKMGPFSRNLYFSDSGPFLQSSIQSPCGSLFMYQFDSQLVSCLSFRNLAYPTGIETDQDEKFLLLSQMGKNRILKFSLTEAFKSNYTVFYQFHGRFGPTAICNFDNNFYVALFQFQDLERNASIAVINSFGQMTEKFYIPIGSEIIGLCINQFTISSTNSSIYVCQKNKIHKVTLKGQSQSKLGDSILKQQC